MDIVALSFQAKVLLLTLGTLLFFITFINTDFALIVLIFSMLLSPEFSLGGIPGRSVVLRFDDILLFVVFFGWLAKMAVNKELGLLRFTPLNRPILAYIFVCMLSSAIGGLRGDVNIKHSFFYILKYIEYFMVFFMVSNNIHEKKQIKKFIFFMLLTCVIVNIYAVSRYFMIGGRATAPFEGEIGEANTLAGYLTVMMAIGFGILLYVRSLRLRLLLIGFLVFSVVPFVYTLSRSGWVAFFAMFSTLIFLSKRGRIFLFLIMLSMMMFIPKVIPRVVEHRLEATFRGGETYDILGKQVTIDKSGSARVRSWLRSIEKWSERPIFGHGIPDTVLADVQYGRVLRETGLLGIVTFLWIIINLFKVGWRSFISLDVDDFGRSLCLGFIAALVGLTAMGAAAEVFIIIRIMEPFWFLAAIVAMLPELHAFSETEQVKIA